MKSCAWALVSACLSPFAHAVVVEPSGRGEVLLVPYYTVNAGYNTSLVITNHTASAKAIKVRFREAIAGRQTGVLNVYLGPYDAWSAGLTTLRLEQTVPPTLLSADRSCTVPALTNSPSVGFGGSSFLTFDNRDFSGSRADQDTSEPARARTGYVEIIEMGTLAAGSASAGRTVQSVTAQLGVQPPDCAGLQAAWAEGGYWQANPATDLAPPTGGLSATSFVIDVPNGTAYQMPTTALARFSVVAQHTAPADPLPDLSSAVTETARQSVESVVLNGGQIYRSHWPQQRAIDAVNAALASDRMVADYVDGAGLDAVTEVVLTFPTRRHYVDPALTAEVLPPFPRPSTLGGPRARSYVGQTLSLTDTSRRRYDSRNVIEDPVPSRIRASAQSVQVHYLTERGAGTLLGAPDAIRWADIDVDIGQVEVYWDESLPSRPAIGGERYSGLAVIGFRATRFANFAAQPGRLAVYSTAASIQPGQVVCQREGVACSGL